jgi:opacity protein-like surface antigen
MFRSFVLALASAFALTGSALAADLRSPPAPPPSPPALPPVYAWTGVYLGGQIGYGWGDNSGNVAFATPGGLAGGGSLGGDAQGVIGGGHVGYNLQINQWVIGLEGAVDATNLSRDVLIGVVDPSGATPGGTLAGSVQSDFQGSIRGRAGFAWDRLLIYGTSGVAFANFTRESNISGADAVGPFFAASSSRSTTRVGWTVGGGVEYAINNNWSVRGEYRYSDFGNIADLPSFPAAGLSYSGNRHLAQNQVQVGFSYRFGGVAAPAPVVAKY